MGQGQKFNTPERLSNKFDAVSAKGNSFSDIVKAANNFLLLHFVSSESSPEEQRIAEANIGFSDAISTSVIPTVNAPNEDERSLQKKKEEESTRDALLAALQRQLQEANERISKMIDECQKMADWCRKQAEKIDETIKKINTEMDKEGQFLHDADEMLEGYRTTGKIDREKVRRALLERGIKTKSDVSDKQLADLLEKERLRTSHHYNDLNELKDRSEKLKEDVLAQEKAARETAREYEQKQRDLNNGQLPLEERVQKTDEVEKKLADKLEHDKEAQKQKEKELNELNSKANESLFEESDPVEIENEASIAQSDFKASGAISKEFSVAAVHLEKEPDLNDRNPENSSESQKKPTRNVSPVN